MVMAAIASEVGAPIDQGGLDVPPPDHQHSLNVVVASAKNSATSAMTHLPGQAAKSRVTKRSIIIAGHKTSVSLEDAFWDSLKEIASERSMTPGELVAAIDGNRQSANLSSAIRLFVLGFYPTGRTITGSAVGGSRGAGGTTAGTDGTAFVGVDGFTGHVISVEADGGGSSGIVAAFGHEGRSPTHGYAATREAEMTAFAKS
jgi:predicted DNA-binding ribbon-helix-helix protein